MAKKDTLCAKYDTPLGPRRDQVVQKEGQQGRLGANG